MSSHNSKFSIWSGYQITIEDFIEFVSNFTDIPQPDAICQKHRHILTYNRWKRRLPANMKRHVPSMRFQFASPEDGSFDKVTHIFFRLRCVDYKGPRQLEDSHPDSKVIKEETPKDRAKLDSFVKGVEAFGGKLDTSKLLFTYMKDLHPSVEWRNF